MLLAGRCLLPGDWSAVFLFNAKFLRQLLQERLLSLWTGSWIVASVCPRFLQLPRIARMVTDAIRDPDRCPGQYQLHAFVVMPITFIC